jgi:hypothetical protein|uniref:Uncharacterized protein n=1 Tax=uncultured marine virus TaxID=186617 RepID=A0A0F7L611_9VIRU|nr:hypothetical protein [uncultured marine virus]
MKIVTATELFLRDREDEKQKAFKTLLTIIKLENAHFTDDDWGIDFGDLVIDIDESYLTINNEPLADWLERVAHGHFNNDKYLTVQSFK